MRAADLSDEQLVAAARSGDSASFGELVRRHGPRLLALAGQLVGGGRAEDMVQEAMIDAWRALPAFEGRSAVATWLHRITVNRCLAELRRHAPVSADVEPMELLARWEDETYSVDPLAVAIRRAEADELAAVIDRLPEGYRLALVLHDGLGLSASEVAEFAGVPLGTAKSNIRRGRMALVSLLGDDGHSLMEAAR